MGYSALRRTLSFNKKNKKPLLWARIRERLSFNKNIDVLSIHRIKKGSTAEYTESKSLLFVEYYFILCRNIDENAELVRLSLCICAAFCLFLNMLTWVILFDKRNISLSPVTQWKSACLPCEQLGFELSSIVHCRLCIERVIWIKYIPGFVY